MQFSSFWYKKIDKYLLHKGKMISRAMESNMLRSRRYPKEVKLQIKVAGLLSAILLFFIYNLPYYGQNRMLSSDTQNVYPGYVVNF